MRKHQGFCLELIFADIYKKELAGFLNSSCLLGSRLSH